MSVIKGAKTMELVVGGQSHVLKLPDSVIEIADWEVSQPIDIAAALENAFDHPIDFPALSEAIVTDDRIALAIEPGLPQMMEIVEGVVGYLLKHGAKPELITILLAQEHEPLAEPLAGRLGSEGELVHKNDAVRLGNSQPCH